ncbi:MAG: ATPase domain-containing protein, partial [Candidatus Hodarchaeota archaeon]
MLLEANFIEGIQKLLVYHNILSISGESGTGKTTLGLFFIGNIISNSKDSCIWIQASEPFPIKRLNQIFGDSPERIAYLRENIFIMPKDHTFYTYEAQSLLIQNLLMPSAILPPNLRCIVIDNISHHLRYKLAQYNNPKDISSLLNRFYDTQLMPLILFCKRNNIVLILIHEVTYSPKLERIRPFFYKLYDRIKTID